MTKKKKKNQKHWWYPLPLSSPPPHSPASSNLAPRCQGRPAPSWPGSLDLHGHTRPRLRSPWVTTGLPSRSTPLSGRRWIPGPDLTPRCPSPCVGLSLCPPRPPITLASVPTRHPLRRARLRPLLWALGVDLVLPPPRKDPEILMPVSLSPPSITIHHQGHHPPPPPPPHLARCLLLPAPSPLHPTPP